MTFRGESADDPRLHDRILNITSWNHQKILFYRFPFSKFPFLLEATKKNCLCSWYNEMRLGLKTFCQLIKT